MILRRFKRFDWKKSPAHLLLLSAFLQPREDYTQGYCLGHSYEDWDSALKETPHKAITRYKNEGVLEKPSLAEHISYMFNVSELKQFLKQLSLPVSGRKSDLVNRLILTDSERMKRETEYLVLFQCSKQGKSIVQQFQSENEKVLQAMEQQVLTALQNHNFSKASSLIVAFEAKQIFPRGININWENYDTTQDVQRLEHIFSKTPQILRNMPEENLVYIRIASGMFSLKWNLGQATKWLEDVTGNKADSFTIGAIRMLNSHAIFLQEKSEIERLKNRIFT